MREGFETVLRVLSGDDLEEALQIMVVLGEAELDCDDVAV